jgi:hypothetical protein
LCQAHMAIGSNSREGIEGGTPKIWGGSVGVKIHFYCSFVIKFPRNPRGPKI